MAHLTVIIVSFIMCISCYFMKRENKLILILVSCLIFNSFNFSSYAFTSIRNLLCIIFFISELKYYPYYIKQLRKVGILKFIGLVVINCIIIIITSHNINNLNTTLGFIVITLISKYFVLAYAFVSLKSISSIKCIYNITFKCLLFMTFIGVINYLLRVPLWNDFFSYTNSGGQINLDAYHGERFRVYSTFRYSFDYGQACVMILIFTLYMNSRHILKRTNLYIAIACCIFGIIFCGCRTVMATFLISTCTYAFLYYHFSKGMGIALTAIFIGILSYSFVPPVREKIDLLASAIDSDSKVTGSSSSMRIRQYEAVISIVKDDIVFGKGHNYFLIDIGWDGNILNMSKKYQDLYGLEGVLMGTLLEYGIIGVLTYIIFYIGLINRLLKYRKYARSEVASAIAIILSFIAFGNMTGELLSAMPTFIFSGILLKIAFIKFTKKDIEKPNIVN